MSGSVVRFDMPNPRFGPFSSRLAFRGPGDDEDRHLPASQFKQSPEAALAAGRREANKRGLCARCRLGDVLFVAVDVFRDEVLVYRKVIIQCPAEGA